MAGYGRTWVQRATQHALVEAVLAFSGGDGGKKWLTASELADKADVNYKSPITVTGIDSYYGANFVYASSNTFGDAFAFVKGNDFFLVVAVSAKEDLGTSAATQAKSQFDFAPQNTIPPSQRPQPAATQSAAYNVGRLVGPVLLFAFIVGIIGLTVGLVTRSRRRASSPIPAALVYGGAVAAVPAVGAMGLSPDHRYWWDGQGWRDAEHEVPSTAQRSANGGHWWDGFTWRQVPRAP